MSRRKIKSTSLDITGLGTKTKNLWNYNTVTMNKYIAANGTLTTATGFAASDFIEVKESTSYVYSYNFYISLIFSGDLSYYYDSNKVKISAIGGNITPFTTPANCKYVRITIFYQSMGGLDHAMLEEGTSPGYYVPYGLVSDYPEIYHSQWFGKKYVPFGDSLTDQTLYPIRVAQAFGMIYHANLGKGGATIWCNATQDAASFADTSSIGAISRIEALPVDAEVITIMGGSNDAGQAKTMGVIADAQMYTVTDGGNPSDPTTVIRHTITELPASPNFYNCYSMLLNRIHNKVPNARVLICEIPLRSMQVYESDGNVEADSFMPYRESVKAIAEKYGYPLIKTYQNAGINELNFETYLVHTQYNHGIHHTTDGGERLAEIIVAGMKTIA